MSGDTEEVEIEYGTNLYVFEWDGTTATLLRVEDRVKFADSSYSSGLPTPVFNKLRWNTDNELTMDEVDLSPAEFGENI